MSFFILLLCILPIIGLYFSARYLRAQPLPGPRRVVGVRNRDRPFRANRAAPPVQDDDHGAEPERERHDLLESGVKLGAKKRAKLEAKAEKRMQREAELAKREERKVQQEEEEAEKKLQLEKEQLEEQKTKEENKKVELEKIRKEQEEYEKLKATFSIDEEGFEENEQEDDGNMLQNFVAFVKEKKVVMLEDLTTEFHLKMQNVIDRIEDLLGSGVLTGVIDDRGKFIYVTQEELQAVADFVKKRGRVSIQELVENSNTLITLNEL